MKQTLWGMVLLSILAVPAFASPITINFEGQVTSVQATGIGIIDASLPLFGSYTFESTLSDACNPPVYVPNLGCYGPIDAFTMTIGTFSSTLNLAQGWNQIWVYNDSDFLSVGASDDGYLLEVGLSSPGLSLFRIRLHDLSATAFSGESLPLTAPDLASFPDLNNWELDLDNLVAAGGKFTSFTLAPVPIPPAVWLFGSALGVMGWMRRKATS